MSLCGVHIGLDMTDTERTNAKPWHVVLAEQGRSMKWLAKATARAPRTIYAYRSGQLIPPPQWLLAASEALGEEVTA
jgi:hypothetical protein